MNKKLQALKNYIENNTKETINLINKKLREDIKSLKNIELIHSRAEDLAKNKSYRENFDKSVSRAVANLTTLAEYDLPFIKKGGQMIAMKGFEIDEELQNAEKAINILGGKIKEVNKFTLIDTDNKRSIVLIDKVKPTPKQFPRKAGKPLKEPIK